MNYLINGSDYLKKMKNFDLVGRDAELEKLTSILVRKKSNSVLLVGPSGVGCTAICVGLQAMKANTDAPFDIVAKRLFWLDVDGLFGTGDSQEIDKHFQLAIETMAKTPNSVLIIEDTGDFYESCKNSGLNHFINLINTTVKDGKLQVIFEVNDHDFDKIIKWHSDVREHYTMLDISEPVGDALHTIVDNASKKLKEYHSIDIEDEAIAVAIELTQKYRVESELNTAQPKRAINLLDRALASYRLRSHKNPPNMGHEDFISTQTKMKEIYHNLRDGEQAIIENEEKLAEMIEQVNSKQNSSDVNHGFSAMIGGTSRHTPEMLKLREKIDMYKKVTLEYRAAFDDITKKINDGLKLSKIEVMSEFSSISGIAVSKLGEDELAILKTLEDNLKKNVFGQDDTIVKTANAIKVAKIGRRNKSKPQAAFLYMGPSGVGKTEITKQVAALLKGDAKAMLRFDMSEYMERHAVSKLIGAPPGYEGFEAGGILTNAMRKNSNRIILFDEIEKAHPDVFNLFLQILDDGRLTDNVGRVVDFSESIIFMTTNIGQPHFLNKEIEFVDAVELAKAELDTHYRPEFLNRFAGRQNIICFNRLEIDSIQKIVKREINDLTKSYSQQGIEIKMSDEQILNFCKDRYEPAVGGRGLPGFIVSQLEPKIVDSILNEWTGAMEIVYNNETRNFDIKH